jgi:hypothetical protein
MPRSRYRFVSADVKIVHRWVRMKFHDKQWPKQWPHVAAWDAFPLERPTAKKLQTWCEQFLNAAQWKQLHAVIRASRRDKDATQTVRLSRQASNLLHALAKRDGLTLSETVLRYLTEILNPPPMVAPAPIVAPEVTAKPARKKKAKATEAVTPVVVMPATPPEPVKKVMKVELHMRVENNNKFVRGKKKAREEIERYVLRYYGMEKPRKDGWEYILSIPYENDEDLEKTIYDILGEASMQADLRHCFIETDVVSVDDPERSW